MARSALIIVDVQNDFCPGGSLAVPDGDQVVPVINELSARFQGLGLPVIATQEWHPADHRQFKEHGGPWPRHCVQGTIGADLHPALHREPITHIVRKGTHSEEDAYSGFQGTGLRGLLKSLKVDQVYVCGLATDYCVDATARDGAESGFATSIVEDAARPIAPDQIPEKRKGWERLGVQVVRSSECLVTNVVDL